MDEEKKRRDVTRWINERLVREQTLRLGRQLGDWQDRLPRIAALLQRTTNVSERADALKDVESIAAELEGARQALAKVVQETPEKLRNHGRFVDLERAIDRMQKAVNEVLGN